jgi:hypothetical protein
MSIIKEALEELQTKSHPVAKVLHKAADSKAIVMVVLRKRNNIFVAFNWHNKTV